MRLDPICELALAVDGALDQARLDGQDGAMYLTGQGRATGARLQGAVRWTNHPRIRADGTTLPDLRGVITTDEAELVLFEIRGVSTALRERPDRDTRAAVLFTAGSERYRWLNDVFCVCEGVFDPIAGSVLFRVYECVNELV